MAFLHCKVIQYELNSLFIVPRATSFHFSPILETFNSWMVPDWIYSLSFLCQNSNTSADVSAKNAIYWEDTLPVYYMVGSSGKETVLLLFIL